MKILLVGELSGSIGVYARNLIGGLSARGIEVAVVTPQPHAVPTDVRAIPVRPMNNRARWPVLAWRFSRALRGLREWPDVVHFLDARESFFSGKVFGSDASTPVVGTMHDYYYALTGLLSGRGTRQIYRDWFGRHLFYNLTRILERHALRRLQGVICVSDAVRVQIGQRYGVPVERARTIHHGIRPQQRDRCGSSSRDGLDRSRSSVLFIGGNFQRKGLGSLIRAAQRVTEDIKDVEFVVVGSSAGADSLLSLVAELRLQENFRFVGRVEHERVIHYLTHADAFVMPSVIEAFGIPFLEAMDAGVPIAATHVSGPDEFLVNGVNALLSAPGDHISLARNIRRLLRDEQISTRLVEAGYRTVASFTVETMIAETVDFYEAQLQWQ